MQAPIDGSRRTTLAGGGFFVLLAGLGAIVLRQSEAGYAGMAMPGDPGPFFLTRLCLWLIGLSGIALITAGLMARSVPGAAPVAARKRSETGKAWLLTAAFTVSLTAMPLAMRTFGTAEAVAIFSIPWIAVLLGLRDGAHSRLLPAALSFGLGAAAFVHVVFVRLLTLPLPS